MAVIASASVTLSTIKDVYSTTRYYLTQSSTLAAPSQPTSNPPSGNWDDTEPSYTAGSSVSLYFVDLTVFSDGSYAYSKVSLSSSYTASTQAANDAAAAKSTAESAQSAVETLSGDFNKNVKSVSETLGDIKTAVETGATYDHYFMEVENGLRVTAKFDDPNNYVGILNSGVYIYVGGVAVSSFVANGIIMGKYMLWHPDESVGGGMAFNSTDSLS